MKTAVSVIIPAYNIEDYIGECLESIIGQTLKNIEIICINDGSADSTLCILEEYSKRDSRIKVLSQENGGQSSARNKGLDIAAGEYVYFMDGDDILESFALEEVYNAACNSDTDIIYFDGSCFSVSGGKYNDIKNDYYIRKNNYPESCSGIEMFCRMSSNDEFRASPCLQLIRKEHLDKNGIRFHNGIIFEDNAFTLLSMISAESAGFINKVYFKRRIRENSTTTAEKQFRHCFGYFMCYMDLAENEDKFAAFSDEEKAAVYGMMDRFIYNARCIYAELSSQEQSKAALLACREKAYFELLVAEPGQLRKNFFSRKKQAEKANDALERAKSENTELKSKLQKAFAENSRKEKEIKSLKKYSFYSLIRRFKRILGKIRVRL